MRLKNTTHTRKLLQSVAAMAAFGLLATTAQGQPIVNGSFEDDTPPAAPSSWDISGSSGVALTQSTYAYSGSNGLVIDSTGVGVWASPNIKQTFDAAPGDVFNLSGMIRHEGVGTSWAVLKIEWVDSGGNNLDANTNGGVINRGVEDGDGQPFVGVVSDQVNTGSAISTWHFRSVEAVAPTGTVSARMVVLNVNADVSTFYYDEIVATRNNQLLNFSFEADADGVNPPTSWTDATGASVGEVDDAVALYGTKSYLIDSTGQGGWSSPNIAQTGFAASPDQIVRLEGWYYSTSGASAERGVLKLEFKDGANASLTPVTVNEGTLDGPGQPYAGILSLPEMNTANSTGTWVYAVAEAVAPAGTVTVSGICMVLNPDADGRAVNFDEVSLTVRDAPSTGLELADQLDITISGADVQLDFDVDYGFDYVVESSTTDLSSFSPTGDLVGGTGTATPASVTVAGAAPTAGNKAFFRIVEGPITEGTPFEGEALVDAAFASDDGSGCLGSGNWSAYAVWFNGNPQGYIFDSPWGLCDAPFTGFGDGTAIFTMNDGLRVADAFWRGGQQIMLVFQDILQADNLAGVRPFTNLYGQQIAFTGIAEVTEAFGTGHINGFSVGPSTSTAAGTYTVTPLSGGIAGVNAGFEVTRDGAGVVTDVKRIDSGTGFVATETVIIPGTSTGGASPLDDILVTVDSVYDSKSEAFIKILDTTNAVVFETYADLSVNDADDSDGKTVNTATGAFSIETTVPASGLNTVQVGFQNTGAESGPGEISIDALSVLSGGLPVVTGELLTNANFSTTDGGADPVDQFLEGWGIFANWEIPKGSYAFGANWGVLADGPLTAINDGAATFGVNDAQRVRDPGAKGGYMNGMSVLQAWWQDGNQDGVTPVTNLQGTTQATVTFTGDIEITQVYDQGIVSNFTPSAGTSLAAQAGKIYEVAATGGTGTGATFRVVRDGTTAGGISAATAASTGVTTWPYFYNLKGLAGDGGSTGTGAEVKLSYSELDGSFTSATILNPGEGFAASDTITIPGASVGTPGNDVVITVTGVSALGGTGAVSSVIFESGGSGYAALDSLTILGSTIGGVDSTDDITITVDDIANNSVEIFIEALNNPGYTLNDDDIQVIDGTTLGTTAFSVSLLVPDPATALNLVQAGIRHRVVENSGGQCKVSNLSAISTQ